ncbi:MAG: hypothetical protein QMD95_04725 [Candidatus Hodarchaeaceae archaeon]|nr:hypothetical protein [Candidatus Hodarchaeaceae archaeon]
MKQGLTFEAVLEAVDRILELPPNDPGSAGGLWRKLDPMLEDMLEAAKLDGGHHKRMLKLMTPLRSAASELAQSLLNSKRGGPLRGDWVRFAERDLVKLKDELLALREFMVEETDFLRFACLRARLRELGGANPEKLFEELHEAGAISERTWVLLMAQPNSWRKALKDQELSRQLTRIAGWLLDLQEARRGWIDEVRETQR